MYFIIPGKNKILSEIELSSLIKDIQIKKENNFWTINKDISNFLKDYPLAGFLKYGIVLEKEKIKDYLQKESTQFLGTNDVKLAKYLKNIGIIKKYKLLKSISNSNIEIKNKGIEILKLGKNIFGITLWFQPIKLYETIDYEKPIRGMQKGMMPTKLTHLLLNIAIGKSDININEKKNNIYIYDPFTGFGTTGFLVNSLGFNFIGSDINITPAKLNLKWWKNTKYYNKNLFFELFKQDICNDFKKKIIKRTNFIVSEGYLGPTIKQFSDLKNKKFLLNKVLPIYKCFFEKIEKSFNQIIAIITIPDYIENEKIYKILPNGLNLEILPEIYKRKNQFVGRKILFIKKL